MNDLASLDYGAARSAANELRESSEFFPSYAAFLGVYRLELARVLERQRNDRGETAQCSACHDTRWCLVGDDPAHVEREVARRPKGVSVEAIAKCLYPCRFCAPEQFVRWRDGHWGMDHTCDLCERLRRNDVHAVEEVRKLAAEVIAANAAMARRPPEPATARIPYAEDF